MYNFLAQTIGDLLKEHFGVSTDVALSSPAEQSHGDIASNVCLQVSKEIGQNPKAIAEVLAETLRGTEGIESVDVAGPGFLNFTLTGSARLQLLQETIGACTPKESKGDAPVIVEYSQPNIAKPLGVHHILSTVIGQAVGNLYRHMGYEVIAWNYLGDWGTQFGKLAIAMEKWGSKELKTTDYTLDQLLDLYVQFHEEAETDPTLEDEAREAFRRLEQGDSSLRAFWQDIVTVTTQSIEQIYDRLHVRFDEVKGESFYEDKMQSVIDEGKKRGVFEEGEGGALIVNFPEETKLPVSMVLKGDGSTLYSTRDLAQVQYRVQHHKPQSILYVVDVAQQLYFQQLFATVEKLGWDVPHLEHVVLGRMSFPDKSMSTRKGNIIQLEKALDEAVKRADQLIAEKESDVQGSEREQLAEMVGIGAFVYAMLSQTRTQNIVFTWEKALTFDGNSGPYLQYTHARARSVLRKAGIDHADIPEELDGATDKEITLMRTLTKFPTVLEDACSEAMPHKLANYLYALCQDFNSFYNDLPILDSEEPTRSLRLGLTSVTADVLKTGAEILTLRVPDRM